MTHETLYKTVRLLIHPEWNVSLDYTLKSWGEPQYGLCIQRNGDPRGFANWAYSPEDLLKTSIDQILDCTEAPNDAR